MLLLRAVTVMRTGKPHILQSMVPIVVTANILPFYSKGDSQEVNIYVEFGIFSRKVKKVVGSCDFGLEMGIRS